MHQVQWGMFFWFLAALVACGEEAEEASPKAGVYLSDVFGAVVLTEGDGFFAGTYTQTVGQEPGTVRVQKIQGEWLGSCEEASLERVSALYGIQIRQGGDIIEGQYDVFGPDLGEEGCLVQCPFRWTFEP